MTLLLLIACIGSVEIPAFRYDEAEACWAADTYVADRAYWYAFAGTGGCTDLTFHMLTTEGVCWEFPGDCGGPFADDPTVAAASVQGACPKAWEEAGTCN